MFFSRNSVDNINKNLDLQQKSTSIIYIKENETAEKSKIYDNKNLNVKLNQ